MTAANGWSRLIEEEQMLPDPKGPASVRLNVTTHFVLMPLGRQNRTGMYQLAGASPRPRWKQDKVKKE